MSPLYVRTYVRTYVGTYVRTYVRKYVRTYMRMYVHTYVRTHARTYVRYVGNISSQKISAREDLDMIGFLFKISYVLVRTLCAANRNLRLET